MKFRVIHLLLICCAWASTGLAHLTVFAAASTTDAVREIGARFTKKTGVELRYNIASSGLLARQIEAGAPADVLISANVQWMDYLEEKNAIRKETRFNLASNTLVLIAPHGSPLTFDGNIKGRLAVGDFKSVPAGMYAKEALEHMGWLDALRPNLVMAANVRMAMMYVERGEVAAGIVYGSDAKQSNTIKLVGTFPPESHSPILYPAAACSDHPEALEFIAFLKSPTARSILVAQGFN